MAQFTSYADCLRKVKKLNPDLKHKEAQKLASELWTKQKEAGKVLETKPVTKAKSVSPHLAGIIEEINNNASTINEMQILLANANIKFYEIVKDGKDGANTLVFIKLTGGERIPETGHFKVFC